MFRFFKKVQPSVTVAEVEQLSEFERAAKHRCEVRRLDDHPVFLANVKNYDGSTFRLYPTLNIEAPIVIFNDPYKLVFRVPHQPIPAWTANVQGSTSEFWKMGQLTRIHDEQRASFRAAVSLVAVVRHLLGLPAAREELGTSHFAGDYDRCEVLDVGMGGMRLHSHLPFQVDDLLAVTDLHLHNDPKPFSLPMQVRWKAAEANGSYCYGCAFHSVPVLEERRLCAAMFGLQRTHQMAYR